MGNYKKKGFTIHPNQRLLVVSVERVSAVTQFSAVDSFTGFISGDIVGPLRQNYEFRCRLCRGIARPIEERPQTKW